MRSWMLVGFMCASCASDVSMDGDASTPETSAAAKRTCDVDGAPLLEIGVPDFQDFFVYQGFNAGGAIPMSSAGQAGIGIMLALEGDNFDQEVSVRARMAWDPGEEGVPPLITELTRAERWVCRDGRLVLSPLIFDGLMLHVWAAALDGETVDAVVTVEDDSGRSLTRETKGVLTLL